jgi:hypothetical protein
MNRRRFTLVLTVVVVAGILGGVYWDAQPCVTRERMERVTVGMTYAEVVATVGGPPGDYSGGTVVKGAKCVVPQEEEEKLSDFEWVCPKAVLLVDLDCDGRASRVEILSVPEDRMPFLMRLAYLFDQ